MLLLAVGEMNADQVHQALSAAGQVPAQAKQALALLAEGVEADTDGPAIGPKNLVALEGNLLVLAVSCGAPLQEEA